MDSQKLSQNDWLPQASQLSPRYLVARGVAVLAVIICLIIVASLGGALVFDLKTGWEDYRQSRLALQADWLIASAIDRVRSQLLTNPDYPGETWKINAEKLDGRSSAEIQITIIRADEVSKKTAAKVALQLMSNGRTQLALTRLIPVEIVSQTEKKTGEEVPTGN